MGQPDRVLARATLPDRRAARGRGPKPRRAAVGLVAVALVLLVEGTTAAAPAKPRAGATHAVTPRRLAFAGASACLRRRVRSRLNSASGTAKLRYNEERHGVAVHRARSRFVHDRALVRSLATADYGAAHAEAERQLTGHVVRARITRGSKVLVDANPASFAVAGAIGAMRAKSGKSLAQIEVSIQDVVGFIKLVHKFTGAEVVVRGTQGRAITSLASLPQSPLPTSGCTSIQGSSYAVRFFRESGFAAQPLRIWVMVAA